MFIKVEDEPRNVAAKEAKFTRAFFKAVRWILLVGIISPGRPFNVSSKRCSSKLMNAFVILYVFLYIVEVGVLCYNTQISVRQGEDFTRQLGFMAIVASSVYMTVVFSVSMSQSLPKLEEMFLKFEQQYGMSRSVVHLPKYTKLSIFGMAIALAGIFVFHSMFMKKSVRIFCEVFPLCKIPQPWYGIAFPLYVAMFVTSYLQWGGLTVLCVFFALFLAREFNHLTDNFKELIKSPVETEEIFTQLVDKHRALVDLLEGVNGCFQHFSFVTLFLLIPINCVFLYASLSHSEDLLYFLSVMTGSLSGNGIRLLMDARVNKKVHEPLDYVWKLKREYFSDRGLQNLTLFTNRLMGENIGYNIYGLLTISMPTLLGIFGTLITYIIVVVQFRPSDSPCQCDCMKNVSYCIMDQ